jgi:hypothetical protein
MECEIFVVKMEILQLTTTAFDFVYTSLFLLS